MINFLNDLSEGKKAPIFYLRDFKNGDNFSKYILEANSKLLQKHNIFVKVDKKIYLIDNWKNVSVAYKVDLINIKCQIRKSFFITWLNDLRDNVVYDYILTTNNLLNQENQWIREIKKGLEKRYIFPLSTSDLIKKFLRKKVLKEIKKWIANYISNSEKDFYRNIKKIKIIKDKNIQLFTASKVNNWIKENIEDKSDVLFSISIEIFKNLKK